MEMLFSLTAKKFTGSFQKFEPFPAAGNRTAYEMLASDLKAKIIKEGETFLNYSYPSLRATDFMAFQRTGNRSDYEALYFAKRHALNSLVLAECIENKGRFLDDIINGIFSLCEESAWQLPAHNSYIRDTPQLILPDTDRPVLDLFACETGALLACIYYLLRESLDAISPFISKRILSELNSRIIAPYLLKHFWWMGKEGEPMCNWTVWCTQNVLLTSFLGSFDENTRKAVFQKSADSCDYFLKDYGDDGCCNEGAQYYRHAGLCLFNTMNILNEVSGGCFEELFHRQKIRNIASYILNVHVNDKYYFNFADCSPIAGRAGVREFLFGQKTGQPDLMLFAAKDFKASGGELYSDESNRINLFYRLQTLFHYEEIMNYDTDLPVSYPDLYYPSVGLFLARTSSLCLAVKTGCNADSHNHNDTGSFTLYKNGQPLFIDIGVETYTAKTFSSNRYEIWTMQSCYHNLPTINGLDQKDGSDYRADQVYALPDGDTPSISMNISKAYPGLSAPYFRRITLNKQKNCVILEDQTENKHVILNFITYEKPEINDSEIILGTLGTVSFQGAVLTCIDILPITDPRLQKAWDHDLYRIRLTLTKKNFYMEIT